MPPARPSGCLHEARAHLCYHLLIHLPDNQMVLQKMDKYTAFALQANATCGECAAPVQPAGPHLLLLGTCRCMHAAPRSSATHSSTRPLPPAAPCVGHMFAGPPAPRMSPSRIPQSEHARASCPALVPMFPCCCRPAGTSKIGVVGLVTMSADGKNVNVEEA